MDTTEEFITVHAPELVSSAKSVGSRLFSQAGRVFEKWRRGRGKLWSEMQRALREAYEAENMEEAWRHLARYLSCFLWMIGTMPPGTEKWEALRTLEKRIEAFEDFEEWAERLGARKA